MAREFQDRTLEFRILNNLGDLFLGMHDHESARISFERILDIAGDDISHFDLAVAQANLAASLPVPEQYDRAVRLYRSALSTFRSTGSVRHEANALNGLGGTLLATGRSADARDQYALARELARSVGAAREEVTALRGLGECELTLGARATAALLLTEAVALADRIKAADELALARESLARTRDEHDA